MYRTVPYARSRLGRFEFYLGTSGRTARQLRPQSNHNTVNMPPRLRQGALQFISRTVDTRSSWEKLFAAAQEMNNDFPDMPEVENDDELETAIADKEEEVIERAEAVAAQADGLDVPDDSSLANVNKLVEAAANAIGESAIPAALRTAIAQAHQLEQDNSRLLQQNAEKDGAITEHQKNVSRLLQYQTEARNLRGEKAELLRNEAGLKRDARDLQEALVKMKGLERDLNKSKSDLLASTNRISTLEDEGRQNSIAWSETKDKMERELGEKNTELVNLQTLRGDLEKSVSDLLASTDRVSTLEDEGRQNSTAWSETKESLERELSRKETELVDLQTLRGDLEKSKSDLLASTNRISDVEAENQTLLSAKIDLTDNVSRLEGDLQSANAKCDACECDSKDVEITRLKRLVLTGSESMAKITEQHRCELDTSDARFYAEQTKGIDVANRLRNLHVDYEEMFGERNDLFSKYDTLEQRFAELDIVHDNLARDHQKVLQQARDLYVAWVSRGSEMRKTQAESEMALRNSDMERIKMIQTHREDFQSLNEYTAYLKNVCESLFPTITQLPNVSTRYHPASQPE